MTEGVVLAVGAAVIATLAFLATARRPSGGVGRHARPARWAARTLVGILPVVLAGAVLVFWIQPEALLWPVVGLSLATVAWLPGTRRWSAWAHASWSLTVAAGASYVVAMAVWTAGSGLGGLALAGGWLLWVLELGAFVMLLSYGWEIHDSLGSLVWSRRLPDGASSAARPDAGDLPFVSIHVPSHQEPPDLVIATLQALLSLDYPAYEVLVIDNNTRDDALCAPVEAFCASHPEQLRFFRLLDWPGYKSGALNYAEAQSDPRTSLIAVVDADYQVDPDWLRESVGAFADPAVGFVQSPQDYRDWSHVQYLRSLFYSYDYFFRVSQPSRDERNAAIFGGTMGLVRRQALDEVGGWDEWCVTEDAELSLRLLQHGWSGHHLDRSFGHGIMPLTFEALKRQRFRWCFGGMQILKRHAGSLMPWSRRGEMTVSQRLAYLVGGLQWFGDPLGLMFSFFVMASLVDLALGGGLVVRRLSGLLLVAAPALVGLGMLRAAAVLKAVGNEATWRDALGAFLMWLSLGWVVTLACARGLVEPRGVFLRTPKVRGDVRWSDAARANAPEVVLAMLAVTSAVLAMVLRPGWVSGGLSALLVVPVSGWLAAPAHSVAALRADLPADLRRRRTGEWARGWWGPRARVSAASALVVAAMVGLLFAIVQPTSRQAPQQTVLPHLQSRSPGTPGPSTTVVPSGTSSSTTSSSTGTGPAGPATHRGGTVTPSGLPTQASPTSVSSPAARPTGSPSTRPTGSPTTRPTGSPTTRPTPSRRPTTPGPGRP